MDRTSGPNRVTRAFQARWSLRAAAWTSAGRSPSLADPPRGPWTCGRTPSRSHGARFIDWDGALIAVLAVRDPARDRAGAAGLPRRARADPNGSHARTGPRV